MKFRFYTLTIAILIGMVLYFGLILPNMDPGFLRLTVCFIMGYVLGHGASRFAQALEEDERIRNEK